MKPKNLKKELVISIIAVFATVFLLTLFNRYILLRLPIGIRMISMIGTQWLLFLVPAVSMKINKEKIADLEFKKENIAWQIAVGLMLAFAMSLVLTLLPILLGFKDMVGGNDYKKVWQFAYHFVYAIAGVALSEELIFRGYFYKKFLMLKESKVFAIIMSSVLFGLFHIFNGNAIQVIVTAVLGMLFCVFREKINSCTLLSLIIAHGVYDALVHVWAALI